MEATDKHCCYRVFKISMRTFFFFACSMSTIKGWHCYLCYLYVFMGHLSHYDVDYYASLVF